MTPILLRRSKWENRRTGGHSNSSSFSQSSISWSRGWAISSKSCEGGGGVRGAGSGGGSGTGPVGTDGSATKARKVQTSSFTASSCSRTLWSTARCFATSASSLAICSTWPVSCFRNLFWDCTFSQSNCSRSLVLSSLEEPPTSHTWRSPLQTWPSEEAWVLQAALQVTQRNQHLWVGFQPQHLAVHEEARHAVPEPWAARC